MNDVKEPWERLFIADGELDFNFWMERFGDFDLAVMYTIQCIKMDSQRRLKKALAESTIELTRIYMGLMAKHKVIDHAKAHAMIGLTAKQAIEAMNNLSIAVSKNIKKLEHERSKTQNCR